MMAKMRRWRVPVARGAVQVSVMVLIAVGPWFGLANGSICTLTVGGVTLSCPLSFLQGSAGASTILVGIIGSIAIPILIALFMGRIFCGWICPASLGLELSRNLLTSGKPTTSTGRNPIQFLGVVLIGAFLASSALFHYPFFCIFCPVGVICRNVISFTQYGALGMDVIFIPAFMLFEAVFARWCPEICPLGAMTTIISRFNFLNPRINEAKCVKCQVCNRVCPMRIQVLEGKDLNSCSKCLKCSEGCPTDAIDWKSGREPP